jgi:hypothetical protein
VIVNPIEYGDVSGMVLSHFNLQPIAFVEKATLPDVLPCLCCELAMDACLRFWRTFPLVPGDCLNLKWSIMMTNPDSLAFVIHCGDALQVFKFKTGASSDSFLSINSSCSFLLP